jgi:5-methylthioadenosine/S-adenosylhomocysteine deaminase
MKIAALAQKGRYGRASAMTADRALAMGTIDGARALGLDHQIGSLEQGKKADLVLLDFERPHLYPRHSVSSALVYQANGSEVDTVLVDGRVLVTGGRLVALEPDEAALLGQRAQRASARVARRARLAGFPGGRPTAPVAGRHPTGTREFS